MSLRSIAMYGKNVGRVFVCGHCPDWLSDEVVKLPLDTVPAEDSIGKGNDMLRKILHAVDHSDISDEFLCSMDDHFYVRETDFDNYPWYVRTYADGDNGELPSGEQKTEYKRYLALSREFLESQGLPTLNFTLHRNMHLSRGTITECRDLLDRVLEAVTPVEPFVLINNFQHARHGIDYTVIKDVKLRGGIDWWKTDPRDTEVFSTPNFEPGLGLYTLISGLYVEPSKYENHV